MIAIDEIKEEAGAEIAALILICRVFLKTAHPDDLAVFLEKNDINWQLFYNMACVHRIRPIVYKVVSGLDLNQDIQVKLQQDCRQIALKNFEHCKEFIRLNDLFEQAGITAIPYKGCIFGIQFYDDVSLRESSDLDFLINPHIQEVDAITGILENNGYTAGAKIPGAFKEFYFHHIREFKFLLFAGGQRKFLAEFHLSLNDPVFETQQPISNEYLFTGLNEITITGSKIKTLSLAKHLIAVISHHGIREQWTSLKNLLDVAMGINNEAVDWNIIFDCSHRHRFRKGLNTGLQIINDVLGVPPPVGYQSVKTAAPWLKALFSRHLTRADGTWSNNFILKLKSKDTAGDRLKLIFRHLRYTASPSILDYNFIKLPKPFFPLYIFIKPMRMLFNSLKK